MFWGTFIFGILLFSKSFFFFLQLLLFFPLAITLVMRARVAFHHQSINQGLEDSFTISFFFFFFSPY